MSFQFFYSDEGGVCVRLFVLMECIIIFILIDPICPAVEGGSELLNSPSLSNYFDY
jgi:hypothetical protein